MSFSMTPKPRIYSSLTLGKGRSKFVVIVIGEFESVYKGLYSGDIDRQVYAVGRCHVWKSRVTHKLSVAIESTASLCSACITHQKILGNPDFNNHYQSLCSEYSVALIRFVNHVTEKGQNRAFSVPVHVIAAEFGVPEWIVELRHNATHGQMPPLSMLKSGTEWALNWLKASFGSEFWEAQLQTMMTTRHREPEKDRPKVTKDDVCSVLDDYVQERCNTMTKSYKGKYPKVNALGGIEKMLSLDKSMAIGCLLTEDYMLNNDGIYPTFDSSSESDSDVIQVEDLLPVKNIFFWKPVLQLLERTKQLQMLLTEMVAMVTDEDSTKNSLLVDWITTIVKANEGNDDELKSLFKSKQPLFYRRLLEDCIRVPNRNTAALVQFLLQHDVESLPEAAINHINNLSDIYQGRVISPLENADQQTCKSIKDLHGKEHSAFIDQISPENSSWTLCDKDRIDWSSCPFGLLPWQHIRYHDLDLDKDQIPDLDVYDEELCDTIENNSDKSSPMDSRQVQMSIVGIRI
ncbi:hypothetical protein FSP39_004563 [Pinctada imbricata]|uniref:Uncharacterized protein n=1 Tax=Pinctada imbricata TaxID=66713 RepID=A0AA89BWF7_PINIB|nr:hypothetical protein FSP39_004563 [Pinctada imbricata]